MSLKFIIPAVVLMFSMTAVHAQSQPSSQTADKMAGEVCEAMLHYVEGNTDSLMKVVDALYKISLKEQEYAEVTEEQLMNSMQQQCPAGREKFITLVIEGTPSEPKEEESGE